MPGEDQAHPQAEQPGAAMSSVQYHSHATEPNTPAQATALAVDDPRSDGSRSAKHHQHPKVGCYCTGLNLEIGDRFMSAVCLNLCQLLFLSLFRFFWIAPKAVFAKGHPR